MVLVSFVKDAAYSVKISYSIPMYCTTCITSIMFFIVYSMFLFIYLFIYFFTTNKKTWLTEIKICHKTTVQDQICKHWVLSLHEACNNLLSYQVAVGSTGIIQLCAFTVDIRVNYHPVMGKLENWWTYKKTGEKFV